MKKDAVKIIINFLLFNVDFNDFDVLLNVYYSLGISSIYGEYYLSSI